MTSIGMELVNGKPARHPRGGHAYGSSTRSYLLPLEAPTPHPRRSPFVMGAFSSSIRLPLNFMCKWGLCPALRWLCNTQVVSGALSAEGGASCHCT